VGFKGHDPKGRTGIGGGLSGQVDDCPMANVHAIEITNRCGGATVAWVNENGVSDNAHGFA
jgi:hypothetical protein